MKREYMLDDVIAAISTPIGTGGIGIVRMSGAGCIALADSIFIGKKKLTEKATHTLSYGKITDGQGGEVIDEVLVSVMKAPHTYTKEDIVEINCHGGSLVTRRVLEEDRAIVTDIPGTTRDTVEEYLNIDGIPIKIVDTAGIRETGDVVEKMGVEKSKAYAETADLVIMMLDGSRPLEEEDKEILSFIRGKKTIVLLNKVDLAQKLSLEELAEYVQQEQILFISVKENDGFDALLDALKNMFLDGHTATAEDAMLGNTRHKDALYRAKEAMEHCMETITMRMPEDFISMDLQDANRALGEITGDTSDEEIIDRIFTKFCLGK